MKLKEILLKDDNIILLSLREQYFNSILNGTKLYEYRKVYKKEKSKAIIYISKTKKNIAGIIEFGKPIIDTSENISKLAQINGDSEYQSMIQYLGENKKGYAIPINKVYIFEESLPVDLIKEKGIKFIAPQSYSDLKNNKDLLNYISEKNIKFIR